MRDLDEASARQEITRRRESGQRQTVRRGRRRDDLAIPSPGMIRIRRAAAGDLPGILDLLRLSELPVEGVGENLGRFLVAEEDGRLVGSAGLEMGDGCALLRSVAVWPSARGTGVGVEIVRQALRLASASGAGAVYLLTTTAAGFFPRFGFVPALRAEIDAKFPDSSETREGGCCATAAALVLRDLSRILQPHRRG